MRRRTDPVLLKLRQLARNGQRAAALQLLQDTLRKNPANAYIREELTRHLTGRPYTFEEKLYAELKNILADYLTNPAMLAKGKRRGIRQLSKRVHYLQRELAHILTDAESKNLNQLRQSIARESSRRRNHRIRPLGVAAGLLLAALLLFGGYSYLNNRAEAAAATLHHACEDKTISIAAAERLLTVHDTGLNRTFNRNVGMGAERLRAHIRAAHKRSKTLDTIFRSIESGKQSVVSQGISKRAEIQRMLKLPCSNASALKRRWEALCQAENDALTQQRLALAEELMAPLPAQATLTGELENDALLVEKRRKLLQKRIDLFDEAGEELGVSAEIIKSVQKELQANQQLQDEIKALQLTLQLLSSAHDYDTYRARLEELNAQYYQPGVQLLKIRQLMPAENTIKGMMQEHGQNLPQGLLQASQHCLLEGAPSFSKDFPATREQLLLLNELLNNAALRTRLYELTHTVNHALAYTEQQPALQEERVCFLRSAIDPARKLTQDKAEQWEQPHAVLIREIDTRPLHTGLGFANRSGFFSSANLPQLLTNVFRIEGAHIPALARAYVFHHLVQANAAAAEPILNGLRFAPNMRQRIQEFEKLRKECKIELNGNCWLHASPQHAAAERKFARWFSKHRRCDFADEVQHNLGTLLRVEPRFCGYINERLSPVLFEDAKEGQLIWYMGADAAMTVTPWGAPLQQPVPLSPIFIVERQF